MFGIFGELHAEDGSFIGVTLEHSYNLKPKLPPGLYKCVRGVHRLHSASIETFEITGVPGHTGILFHCGNSQNDSAGCVLLGDRIGTMCILDSRPTFNRFMDLQAGINEFNLTVE